MNEAPLPPALPAPRKDPNDHTMAVIIATVIGTTSYFFPIVGGLYWPRATKWGALAVGLFIVVDLGRANQPWVIVWDYQSKYATDPVIEMLRQKPYEHRVAILPFPPPSRELALMYDVYRIEWAQHHFQFYNIQSLDIVQMPGTPADMVAFEGALRPVPTTSRGSRKAD